MLCDRGVPDILAHHLKVEAKARGSRVSLLRLFLQEWLGSYDLLLFSRIEPSLPIVPDGLRVEDPAYRIELDESAAKVLEGLERVIELPGGRTERAVYAFDAVICRLGPLTNRN